MSKVIVWLQLLRSGSPSTLVKLTAYSYTVPSFSVFNWSKVGLLLLGSSRFIRKLLPALEIFSDTMMEELPTSSHLSFNAPLTRRNSWNSTWVLDQIIISQQMELSTFCVEMGSMRQYRSMGTLPSGRATGSPFLSTASVMAASILLPTDRFTCANTVSNSGSFV